MSSTFDQKIKAEVKILHFCKYSTRVVIRTPSYNNMFKYSDRFEVDFSLKHLIKAAAYKDICL